MNSGARAHEYNRWHCHDRLQGSGVLIATRGSTPGRSKILKPLGAAGLPLDEVVEHLHNVLVTEVVTAFPNDDDDGGGVLETAGIPGRTPRDGADSPSTSTHAGDLDALSVLGAPGSVSSLTMQPIEVSEQLALMPLELRDADELFELTDRNRAYLRHWLPWLDNITRPEDTRAFVRAAQAQGSQNNGTQLAIRLKGRIVGIVGHHQIDWRNRLTSLGYWIGEEFQGRGLVTIASRALVGHAFNQAQLNRVEIRCATGNDRSRAVPVRLGFREEGLLRDAEWLYDHFVDHIVYSMLARDWAATVERASNTVPPTNAAGG